MPKADSASNEDFLRTLAGFYAESGRHDMPWRQPDADGTHDPYKILVSELMLQQTQVARVTPKYLAFIAKFPNIGSLAAASLGEVLVMWSGLGYNRRAKYLHQSTAAVVHDFGGVFPRSVVELQSLPGVGPGTAGAIMAYAYDQSVSYLETNIRTVLIHQFYHDQSDIADSQLRETLDQIVKLPIFHEYFTPREFYWAMMDYGSYLKRSVGNLNRASKAYTRQSAFQGSRRQVRGLVLRLLTAEPLNYQALVTEVADERLDSVLSDLVAEGMVTRRGSEYSI